MSKTTFLGAMILLLLKTGIIVTSKDPKEFVMLLAPSSVRVDQNKRTPISSVTPPRSPRPLKVYEKAVWATKKQRK